MRKIILLLLIFSAFLLESRISIFGAQPDLAAAIAYYFGLKNGETKGMLFGSFIGLIGDSLSGGILGPNILGKGMVGFLSAFMSGSFFRWTPVLGVIGISLLTALNGIIVFLSKTLFEHMPTSIPSAMSIIFTAALINSLFGIFMRPQNEQ
ncbi:MAG: rod shape-determining protein MreD [Thermodesulfovibrionales bacterium]|nr:rod shape-determining protein MreD [Thermodesulfovibrionales bacterium]